MSVVKYLVALTFLFLAGCGTVKIKTLEYCDVEQETFIGIPYSSATECIGVSNSDVGRGINIPEQPEE